MYFVMSFVEAIVKATPTKKDDKALKKLKMFFLYNTNIRTGLFSVLSRGWQNKFDVHDEEWTQDVLNLFFDVISTQFDEDQFDADKAA